MLAAFDQHTCDRTATALVATGQVQVPTLVLPYFEAQGSTTTFRDDPRWRNLRADEQARWERILAERAHADDGGLAGAALGDLAPYRHDAARGGGAPARRH